jgi:phage terminase large subunit
MRRAYRYGDWNALSGAYFPEFSEDRHIVRPFAIPDEWPRYRAFDYGLDMLACLWIAIDARGGVMYIVK